MGEVIETKNIETTAVKENNEINRRVNY